MEEYYKLQYNDLKEKVESLLLIELNQKDDDLTNFIINKALEYKSKNDFYEFIKENEPEFKFDTAIKIYYYVENFHPKKNSIDNNRDHSFDNEKKKEKKIKLNKITKFKIINVKYNGLLVKLKRENYRHNGFIHKNEIPKNIIDFNHSNFQQKDNLIDKKFYGKITNIEYKRNNRFIYLSMKNLEPKYTNNLKYGAITGINLDNLNEEYKVENYEDPWEKNILDRANNKPSINLKDLNEEYFDIKINKNEPEFLKGQTSKTGVILSPPKLIKNEEGFLNKEVINTVKISKDRINKRFENIKITQNNIPNNFNKIINDPLLGNNNIISLEKKNYFSYKNNNSKPNAPSPKLEKKINYKKENPKILDLKKEKENLPIFKFKNEFLNEVKNNQIIILIGETGSGKTTQITQYLYNNGYCNNSKKIACTQPRRIATISVSKRVSEEMGVELGKEVGYSIRFEDVTSRNTKIKYMTDGMLLREILIDKNLNNYSVIILDEAHERNINTDVLMGLLKQTIKERPDLKLIITSATLDSEKFSKYFFNCNTFKIPGRTFPVKILFTKEPETNYFESSINSVMQIHLNEPKGDILLFLTGEEEINSACQIINERLGNLKDIPELICLPVYSALPTEKQNRILEPTPEGKRKCVIATNIAEASLTIDGIYYVIDPGFCKIKSYNPKTCMDSLIISPISQASANQRSGRAGRIGPGKCYRLYTESSFINEMLSTTLPEIKRTNLSNAVLILKAMGINDILNFDFMDKPSRHHLVSALENLYYLGALNEKGLIKELGFKMSNFPLDPELSKILLTSIDLKCSDEIITIISLINVPNLFFRSKDNQNLADEKRVKFNQIEGDHITLLKIYEVWKYNKYSAVWCEDNFIHYRLLKRARDIRNQLIKIFDKVKIPLISCKGNYNLIRKSICSGFFAKCAKRDIKNSYKTLLNNQIVYIHPTSSLYNKNPEFIVYNELIFTSKEYMRKITTIDQHWLLEVAPHLFQKTNNREQCMIDVEILDKKKGPRIINQNINLQEIYKNY